MSSEKLAYPEQTDDSDQARNLVLAATALGCSALRMPYLVTAATNIYMKTYVDARTALHQQGFLTYDLQTYNDKLTPQAHELLAEPTPPGYDQAAQLVADIHNSLGSQPV